MLQNVILNYLVEYEKLVRSSSELMKSSAGDNASSASYAKWKNDNTECLLRLRKLSEHPLLSEIALFLHKRNFRMGKEYYISQSLDSDLDAAAAHRA